MTTIAAVPAYPEDDKLGPLATTIDDDLRGRVVRAATDALAAARAAEGRVTSAPHEAVHEVRKSLRRLRALVALVTRALPKGERKALDRGLAAARRSLGATRDQEVARDVLRGAAAAPELAAPAAAVLAASELDRATPDAIVADVAHAVAEASKHAEALIAALPNEIKPRQLARGVARTYARARKARKKARRSDRAVHRWRRRSKELSYQLAVVDALPGTDEFRAALGSLDDVLSPIVDRIMAKDFVRTYGAGGVPEDAALLLTHVHDELLARKDEARLVSRDLFGTRPRKLRKRLAAALRPAPTDDDHDMGDVD